MATHAPDEKVSKDTMLKLRVLVADLPSVTGRQDGLAGGPCERVSKGGCHRAGAVAAFAFCRGPLAAGVKQ